jgi:hypothetical protein
MAGLAVFERVTFFVSESVDALQKKYFPGSPPVDFHSSPIRSARGFWRSVDPATRRFVLQDIAQVIARANDPGVRLFAAVIEKDASLYGEEAVRSATEQICKRFETLLARRANEFHDKQRGLLVFAESHFQQRAKIWVRGFRQLGTQWGVLNNLADIPYFAAARENRLLQLADYVAHATYLLYERRDASLITGILQRFDQKNGILHGLVHVGTSKGPGCDCPACISRRSPGSFGPWI